MIAFTDVHYVEPNARAACVIVKEWSDEVASAEHVVDVNDVAPYEPGAFFKRELPCLLAVLRSVATVQTIVIDGYVWLDGEQMPGLGSHLFDVLKIPIIGIAKTAYRGSEFAVRVGRPGSTKPLFVTSVGMPIDEAVAKVGELHGSFRIPTLLKRVDALARGRVE